MKILEKLNINTCVIDGTECISVLDFAEVVNKTPSHIHNLMKKGNAVRKLKNIRALGVSFIPTEEIIKFPFTTVGRTSQVYYYKEDGSTTSVEPKKR